MQQNKKTINRNCVPLCQYMTAANMPVSYTNPASRMLVRRHSTAHMGVSGGTVQHIWVYLQVHRWRADEIKCQIKPWLTMDSVRRCCTYPKNTP